MKTLTTIGGIVWFVFAPFTFFLWIVNNLFSWEVNTTGQIVLLVCLFLLRKWINNKQNIVSGTDITFDIVPSTLQFFNVGKEIFVVALGKEKSGAFYLVGHHLQNETIDPDRQWEKAIHIPEPNFLAIQQHLNSLLSDLYVGVDKQKNRGTIE